MMEEETVPQYLKEQFPEPPREPGTITDAQAKYIRDLLDQREVADESREKALAELPYLAKGDASRWIERLRSLPYRERRADDATSESRFWRTALKDVTTDADKAEIKIPYLTDGNVVVPRGSYALETTSPDATNALAFYKVWIGNYGGNFWAIYHLIGPEQQKVPRQQAAAILDKIAANPGEAAKRYGLEIGKCGICGRRLTNDLSRELGIGPICRANWGW